MFISHQMILYLRYLSARVPCVTVITWDIRQILRDNIHIAIVGPEPIVCIIRPLVIEG
jgi:hypothetical protein